MKRLEYAIVFVSDMARGVAFYRDTLGLPLKFESAHWTEFANAGSTIALHQADAEHPAGHCQLGISFGAEGLDTMHQKFQAGGVKCLQPPTDTPFGIRQAVYADPDGLRFTLAEPIKK